MKIFFLYLLWFCSVFCSAQTKVILDTDIDSDVDDVQALAMLHAYQKMGKIDLLGVIVTSPDSYAYRCADAINTYYGHSDIPIGCLRGQGNWGSFSKYTRKVSEEFPHALTSVENTVLSAELYRKLLAKSGDDSVIIVTIGHLSSLRDLLQSEGDEISPLSGKELVNRKVKKWLCMGGQFPEGLEANFHRPDPASTVYCLDQWEKEVIFCGWEVGNRIITGGDYLKSKLSSSSPLYRSYELYNQFAGRPAWDQVAVLLLDEPLASRYFRINGGGYVSVSKKGSSQWHEGKAKTGKHHAYVSIKENVDPETIARTMDDLILGLESH